MATKEQMKQEAIARIKELTSKYNLNPNILKYFKQGKVYYSYLTCMGFMGSIDTVSYDERYEAVVKKFEEKTGFIVYHAVESKILGEVDGEVFEYEMLSLLFVSNKEEYWEGERLYKNYIRTNTVNFSNTACSEYGDIEVMRFGESGALIRAI